MLNCELECDYCGKKSGWYTPVKVDKTHRQSMAEMGFYENILGACLCADCYKLNKQTGRGRV